jgi:hypothetical protein
VTRHAGPALWAGGGDPDIELRVTLPELLAHTQPEVGDLCTGDAGDASASTSSGSSLESGDEDGDAGGGLPRPWPSGSDVVRLVGVVALRRRCGGGERRGLLRRAACPSSRPTPEARGLAA